MFATKKYVNSLIDGDWSSISRLRSCVEWDERTLWQLKRDHENLLARHQRLLDYLGLHEEDLPAETVIRSKGGPESGNRDER